MTLLFPGGGNMDLSIARSFGVRFKEKTRASLLAQGPLSGGFIIDQMLKNLVWDDFGSIKLPKRLFGVEQYWPYFG